MELNESIALVVAKLPADIAKMLVEAAGQVQGMLRLAQQTVVADASSEAYAATDLSQVKEILDRLEAKRKELKAPFLEQVQLIDNTFRQLSEPLNEASRIIRARIGEYRQKQMDANRAVEQARKDAETKAQAEAVTKAIETGAPVVAPVVVNLPPPPTEPPAAIFTPKGRVSSRTVWDWELEDLSKVPAEFICVNEKMVNAVVKAGRHDIPGIRIFQKESVQVRK